MFVKGSLSFDLNGMKCTRKIEKTPREVLSYNVKIRKRVASNKAKNGYFNYKQLLRYLGSRVLQ